MKFERLKWLEEDQETHLLQFSHVSMRRKNTVLGEEGAEVLFGGGVWGAQGLFVCTPHPLHTQSGLYCILQIYTQDVGLECFPEKKDFFFLVSVCFHEQEWLRLTNKPLFPHSQMQGPSSDLQPAKRRSSFNTLKTVKYIAEYYRLAFFFFFKQTNQTLCRYTYRKTVQMHGQNCKARVHPQNICTAACLQWLKSCTRDGLIYICTRTLKVKGKKQWGDVDLPLNSLVSSFGYE